MRRCLRKHRCIQHWTSISRTWYRSNAGTGLQQGTRRFQKGLLNHVACNFFAADVPWFRNHGQRLVPAHVWWTCAYFWAGTPNSRNHFYDIWQGATVGYTNELGEITYNGFVPIKAPYWVIPGRDEAWKMKTLAALQFDEDKFNMEYACISGEVKVKLRNKETGDLLVMSAKELFEEMEKGA